MNRIERITRYEELERERCETWPEGPARSLAFELSNDKLDIFDGMTDEEQKDELANAERKHEEYWRRKRD